MPIVQYVNVFGSHTPWYGICVGIGLLAIGMWMLRSFEVLKMNGAQQNEVLVGFPFAMITGLVFALAIDAMFTGDWRTWMSSGTRQFGFTFTGWLLGVAIFLAMYGGFTSLGHRFFLNFFMPSFALAQGFGRIGCFLGGCCYGCNCSWGVQYPPGSLPYEHMGAVMLFPVQLVEAAALFSLFIICIKQPFEKRGGVYFVGVGILRFVLEFFRADVRGSFFGLSVISPQQILSCLFAFVGIWFLLSQRKQHVQNVVLHHKT